MSAIPEFLFIGAARCASTWVHECLKEHPGVCVPRRPKELHFFNQDENFSRGLDWYRRFWEHRTPAQVCGEVTPAYLCHEPSAARIHDLLPDVKLIVSLRNPIERTYSAYKGHVLAGRIEPGTNVLDADRQLCFDNQSGMVSHGFYHRHLMRYLDLFERRRVLILLYDELISDSAAFIARILRFIDVDDAFVPDNLTRRVHANLESGTARSELIRRLNRAGLGIRTISPRMHRIFEMGVRTIRNRIIRPDSSRVPPDFAQALAPIFAPENQKLAQFLGIDLSHWDASVAQ